MHSDGFVNIYEADGFVDGLDGSFNGSYNDGEEITYNSDLGTITDNNNNEVPIAWRLGSPSQSASNNGDMDVTVIPGGSNGVNLGLGNDYGMMGVSDISSYSGHYQGAGWDYLDIETDQGGMIVDFYSGLQGDENSAFVTWTEGGNTGFTMSEFEALMLSDGNDTVLIGAELVET